jgi:hypothetical protein
MKQGIWQRVLKDKYFPHVSVLTWLRSADTVHPYGSQTWKNLRNTLPIILQWMAWKSGLGSLNYNREGCDFRPGTGCLSISGTGDQSKSKGYPYFISSESVEG